MTSEITNQPSTINHQPFRALRGLALFLAIFLAAASLLYGEMHTFTAPVSGGTNVSYPVSIPAPGHGWLDVQITNTTPDLYFQIELQLTNSETVAYENRYPGAFALARFMTTSGGAYRLNISTRRVDPGTGGSLSPKDAPKAPTPLYVSINHLPVACPFEPNNERSNATPIEPGHPLRANLFPDGDTDWFRFNVPPGDAKRHVTFGLSEIPPDLRASATLYQDESWVANQGSSQPGESFTQSAWIEPDASYFLRIEANSYGAGRSSTSLYTLALNWSSLADPQEKSLSNALPLELNKPAEGTLDPERDSDFYRLDIPLDQRGRLNIRLEGMPEVFCPELTLLNESDREIQRVTAAPPGQPAELSHDLDSGGSWWVRVRGGSMYVGGSYINTFDYKSDQLYRLRATFTPLSEPGEPNPDPNHATPLTLNQSRKAALFPKGDVDVYKISIPENSRGTLQARLDGFSDAFAPHLRLDNAEGREIRSAGGKRSPATALLQPLGQGGTFLLTVRDAGWHDGRSWSSWDDTASLEPYSLALSWIEPAIPENEPNDAFDRAAPLTLGRPQAALLFPAGDTDIFRFDVPPSQTGLVRVAVSGFHGMIRPIVGVFGPSTNLLVQAQRKSQRVFFDVPLTAPGPHFVRIYAESHSWPAFRWIGREEQFTSEPYTVLVSRITSPAQNRPTELEPANSTLSYAQPINPASPVLARLQASDDADWFKLAVSGPTEADIEISDVPPGVDPRAWALFYPSATPPLTPAPQVLLLSGPRGDFNLHQRLPDVRWNAIAHNAPEAKTALASPETLAPYRAVIIDNLHDPESFDLRNPRVLDTLKTYARKGGLVLFSTPFCPLDFLGLGLADVGRWEEDVAVDFNRPHPLLPPPGQRPVRWWPAAESAGVITNAASAGYESLFGHQAAPLDKTITAARREGEGWFVVDMQTLGYSGTWPASEWKIRSYLRMPQPLFLGHFNDTIRADQQGERGAPEWFRLSLPEAGTLFLSVYPGYNTFDTNLTYSLAVNTRSVPRMASSNATPQTARLISLPAVGTNAFTATLCGGTALWLRVEASTPGDCSVEIPQSPPFADPAITIFAANTPLSPVPPRILYLHGERGDFTLDRQFPDLAFERIEWNDARARGILLSVSNLLPYQAIVVDAVTRPDEFSLTSPVARKAVEDYAARGGRFIATAPLCAVEWFGVTNTELNWLHNQSAEPYPPHSLLPVHRSHSDSLRDWPSYENFGFWEVRPDSGFEIAIPSWRDPARLAVTLAKPIGKGWIILDTQLLGQKDNATYAAWLARAWMGAPNASQWREYGRLDGTLGTGPGSGEWFSLPRTGGVYYLRIEDNLPLNEIKSFPVKFAASPAPPYPLEPDDDPLRAVPVAFNENSRANTCPSGDVDWRRITIEERGRLSLLLREVPDNLDLQMTVFRAPSDAPRKRILCLEANPAAQWDFDRFDAIEAETIGAWEPAAYRALEKLSTNYFALIIGSFSDARQFGLDKPENRSRLRRFAAAGGRILVAGARGYSFAANNPQMGARFEGASSQWDNDAWHGIRASDGLKTPRQSGAGWCCGRGTTNLPHTLTWSFPDPRTLSRLILYNHTNTKDARCKDIEVRAGNDGLAWKSLGRFTAADDDARQVFSFPDTSCRFIQLVIHTNYGHGVETQLGEVEFYGSSDEEGLFNVPHAGDSWSGYLAAPDACSPWLRNPDGSSAGTFDSWPDSYSRGWFTDWQRAGFSAILTDREDPDRHAVTLVRSEGAGLIMLEAQPLNTPANADASAWKLARFLDTTDRMVALVNSADPAEGGSETLEIECREPAEYLVKIEDRPETGNYANLSHKPWLFRAEFQPDPDRTEPNDFPADPAFLSPAESLGMAFFPTGDVDWVRFAVETPSDVEVVADDLLPGLGAQLELFRIDPKATPRRILYLACRPDSDLDRRNWGPTPPSFTRVHPGDPEAAQVWDRLSGYGLVILDGLDDLRRFGFDRPDVQAKITRYAEQGGIFLLLAPRSFSLGAFGRERGGRLAASSFSLSANNSWSPRSLLDGRWDFPRSEGLWQSDYGRPLPYSFVLETTNPAVSIQRVVVHNYTPADLCAARDLEILAPQGPNADAWKSLGRFALSNTAARQEFSLTAPAKVSRLQFIIHTNHGYEYNTRMGEIEFFGPNEPETLLGARIERCSPGGYDLAFPQSNHWIIAARALREGGSYYGYDRNFSCWFEDYEAAGFSPVMLLGENGTNRAVTICKNIGKGCIVLDAQDLGAPGQADYMEWKLLNYFDLPLQRLGRLTGTRPNGLITRERVNFFADSGNYALRLTPANTSRASMNPHRLRLRISPVLRPFEPNDSPPTASWLKSGHPIRNTLYPARDADWFRIPLAAGSPLTLVVTNISPFLQPAFRIHSATNFDYTLRHFQNTQGRHPGAPETFTWRAPTSGIYYLKIEAGGYSDERGVAQPFNLTAHFPEIPVTSAPRCVAVSPADGSTGIDTRPAITLTFDSPLDPASVAKSGLTVSEKSDGVIPGAWSWLPDSCQLLFTPSSGIRSNGLVSVSGGSGLRSVWNIAPALIAFSFSTRAPLAKDTETTLSISLDPPPPLGAGARRLIATPSNRLRAAPKLTAAGDDGSPFAISALAERADGSWSGSISIPEGARARSLRFSCSATDVNGRPVRRIIQGRDARLDLEPPGPPASLAATPAPGGRARLLWTRPDGTDDLAGFRIYRSERAITLRPTSSLLLHESRGADVLSFEDPTPRDASWFYAVTAVDAAGNEGPPTPSVSVMTDRIPPAAKIPALAVSVSNKPRVDIRWPDVSAPDVAGYSLYRLPDGLAPTPARLASLKPVHETPVGSAAVADNPGDGAYVYVVAARDPAGNPGPLTAAKPVVVDTKRAWARFNMPAPSPVTAGQYRVNIYLSEPLLDTPALWIDLPGGGRRDLKPARINDTNYMTSVTFTGDDADGWAYFKINGEDRFNNKGIDLWYGGSFYLDTRPPRAWVYWPSPKLGIGSHSVRVDFGENVRDDGAFLSLSVGGVTLTNKLTRVKDNQFVAELRLSASTPNGEATVDVHAVDAQGHAGGEVVSGRSVSIDTRPPESPAGLEVSAAPERSLAIRWAASTQERIASYRVYGDRRQVIIPSTNTLLGESMNLEAIVKPPAAEGEFWITVCAVDAAGNESAPAPAVRSVIDTVPPPPPLAARAELLDNKQVRVTWTPARDSEPVHYRVYRSPTPIASIAGLKPIAETSDAQILDEPDFSGLAHYLILAVDAAGNTSKPVQPAPLAYDVKPPVASLSFSPVAGQRAYSESWYVHYEIPILTPGEIAVTLACNEPLARPPVLRYTAPGNDLPRPVALTARGSAWLGKFSIPPNTPSGLAYFHFEGVDNAGNAGTSIERGKGNLAWFDASAPAAVSGLRADPRPMGKVELSWTPPAGENAAEMKYRIYRSEKPIQDTATLKPLATLDRDAKYLDTPPKDGRYYYAVVPSDLGGLQGPPALADALVDGIAPEPARNLRAEAGKGGVRLTWDPSSSTEPVTYRLWRDATLLAQAHTETNFVDWPPSDGDYSYRLGTVDAAGNGRFTDLPGKVKYAYALPTLTLALDPPPPVRSVFRVIASAAETLREAPELFVSFANTPPRRVGMAAKDDSRQIWVGSVEVDEQTPNGTASFIGSAVNEKGERGDRLSGAVSFAVDTRPPSAQLSLTPPSPLRPGQVAVVLTFSEPLRETPSLHITTLGEQAREIPLQPVNNTFTGAFEIASSDRDGAAFFTLAAVDLAGNVGHAVTPERIAVDTHAPKPPSSLRASPKRDGYIELAWHTPWYDANEVTDDILGYNIYAAESPITSTSGMTPLASRVSRIPCDVRPPADGLWHFTVTTVDFAGWESAPASNATTRSDREPPLPPRFLSATQALSAIRLVWTAQQDSVSFELSVRPPAARDFSVVEPPPSTLHYLYTPLLGGEYSFRLTARDALCHVSLPSAAATVSFAQNAPLAIIRIAPTNHLGYGAFPIRLETTRPLTKAPSLTIHLANGSNVVVTLAGSSSVWTGLLRVAHGWAEGDASFLFSGEALHESKPLTGTGILEGPTLTLDFTPPSAAIRFPADTPQRDKRPLLASGPHPFDLLASEPLRADPVLTFTPRGKSSLPCDLVRLSPASWRGRLMITTNFGDGDGLFEFKGTDLCGNSGETITEGRNVAVQSLPPSRIEHIRAVPLPGGKCRLDWTAPLDSGGKPDKNANTFELFRSDAELTDVSGVMPYRVIHKTLGLMDYPAEDRAYFYAVRAVDDAGNKGPLSACVSAQIDKAPPAPPSDLRATVMSNGVVHLLWDAPSGEAPLFYNIYLTDTPLASIAGRAPMNQGVTWTEIYGTPNHDGRYYFMVTSVDPALNESRPSEPVLLDYRAWPPVAKFTLTSGIWLSAGTQTVLLETTKPLAAPPDVSIHNQNGATYPLSFQGMGNRWQASFTVDDSYPEDVTYGFLFRGVDEAGNVGTEVARTPLFHVDKTPPLPPGNLRVETDTRGTPGAVLLHWNTPKLINAATEVPRFYNIYRARQPIRSIAGLRPLQTVTVEFENLDDYSCRDLPPDNGEWHYAVTSLDTARNESLPSDNFMMDVQSDVPRASISLLASSGNRLAPAPQNPDGLPLVGRGTYRVSLRSSAPLVRPPELSWRLVYETNLPPQIIRMTGAGASWQGELIVKNNYTDIEQAAFSFSGIAAGNKTGRFIAQGENFMIDTVPPVPDILIPSTYKMRVNVADRKLLTPPVRAGRHEVRLLCDEDFGDIPRLWYRLDNGPEIPIPLSGFGRAWSGYMNLPQSERSRAGTFRFEGADRCDNASTNIAKTRYTHDVNDDFPPRRIASYATSGGAFTTDTTPPDAPSDVQTEMRKLGIAVIKWKEPAGQPNSYNLYRSLTPMPSRQGLQPVKSDIFSPIIVDDPPVDGNFFYAVTAVDFAGNESELSENSSVFIDSIKPELKIEAVATGDGFVILMDEDTPPELSLTLRFPGSNRENVELGGDSGELKEYKRVMVAGRPGIVLPQQVGFFNGRVEIVVNSPDPDGNVIEEKTELEFRQIQDAAGGEVESADEQVALIIPPGIEPVIPVGPNETKRVAGYDRLYFIKYANIPSEKKPDDPDRPRTRDEVDPIPPGLEIVGMPYVIQLNAAPEEPLELRGSASQVDFSKLAQLTAKLKMKIPEQYSDSVADTNYLASRLQVIKWVPAKADGKPGRWERVEDVEIEPENNQLIVPAKDITTYVIVAERVPPSVREQNPPGGSATTSFRPDISCKIVDKGTGVAQGGENRIVLSLDGKAVPESHLEMSQGDPTEVALAYKPRANLTPGTHVVTVRAEDIVENVALVRWWFTIDNFPPEILSVSPANGERLAVTRPLIIAHVEDEGGISPEHARLAINGAPLSASAAQYDPESHRLSWTVGRPLAHGRHNVEMIVVDSVGLAVTQQWAFIVDTAGPLLLSASPAPGEHVAEEPVKLNCSLRDVHGSARVLDLRVNNAKLPTSAYSFDPKSGRLQAALTNLPVGDVSVSLLAADDLGNAETHSWTFKRAIPVKKITTAPAADVIPTDEKARQTWFEKQREQARREFERMAGKLPAPTPSPTPSATTPPVRLPPPLPTPAVTLTTSTPPAPDAQALMQYRKLYAEGLYLELKGDTPAALDAYGKCLHIQQDPALVMRMARLKAAPASVTPKITPTPSPRITPTPVPRPTPTASDPVAFRKRFAEAQYLELKGDIPAAIAAYEACQELNPSPALAERIRRLRNPAAPVPTPTLAPTPTPPPSPSDPDILRQVRRARANGMYAETKGDFPAAIRAYEEALRLQPDPALEQRVRNLRASKIFPAAPK